MHSLHRKHPQKQNRTSPVALKSCNREPAVDKQMRNNLVKTIWMTAAIAVLIPTTTLADIRIQFLDVGQADATLIQTSNGCNVLIDGGQHDRNDVLSHLENAGVNHLDILVGTHPHADHIGQFPQILQTLPIQEVWMSGWEHTTRNFENTLDAILQSNANYEEPRAGHVVECGGATLRVVHPVDPLADIHDNIVIRVEYGAFTALIAGDAETPHEEQMMARGEPLDAVVLRLGHHGSHTSTSDAFLQAVAPGLAIYSAGEGNRYGHPHDVALNRVRAQGIPVYGTDVDGTITIVSDGQTHQVTRQHADNTTTPTQQAVGQTTTQCVDINTANVQNLMSIAHIGEGRAEQIVTMRSQQRFESVQALTQITGIGEGRLNDIIREGVACVQ